MVTYCTAYLNCIRRGGDKINTVLQPHFGQLLQVRPLYLTKSNMLDLPKR